MANVLGLSALEIVKKFKDKTLTPTQVLEQVFAQIEKVDPQIKAYVNLYKNEALESAAKIDDLFKKGEVLPPLAGIPIGIKDNICVKNQKTTCSSKILENFVAPYDGSVIKKIKANYLIPFGKTNLDEFAMGSSTENSTFFTTKNPWDLTRVPGGSSGGSAAAVAAGAAVLALGSDTGGSIRQPASYCGVVGFKPTYGRVSRYGLIAFASSLDQIGPITQNVEDCAHLLNVICGHDEADSTSQYIPTQDFTKSLNQEIKGLKIGVPVELFNPKLHPEVKKSIEESIDTFKKLGAIVEITSLKSFEYALPTYYIIAPAEASANLARYDGVRYGFRIKDAKNLREMYKKTRGEGFGPEVKRRIIIGTYVLSAGYYDAFYLKAQRVRNLVRADFARAFSMYDILLTPTAPTPAFKIGEMVNDPLSMYFADTATIPVSLAGLPAVSIPCGFSENNLPLGLQLIANNFADDTVVKVAHAFERSTDFSGKKPPLFRGNS